MPIREIKPSYSEWTLEHSAAGTHSTIHAQNIAVAGTVSLALAAAASGGAVRYNEFTLQHTAAGAHTNHYYGVAWNESTDAYERTGELKGVAVGSSPGNSALSIQPLMRRCVLSATGVVQYYLDPADSTKKLSGAASKLAGEDGQVMVEIPKFYRRYSYASNVHQWDISPILLPGFDVHPAFIKNGVEVDNRYVGAYEGVLFDASAATTTSDYNPIPAHAATFDVDPGIITAAAGTPYARLQAGDVIVVAATAGTYDGTYILATTSATVLTTTSVIAGVDGSATPTITAPTAATASDMLWSVSGKKPFTGVTRATFRDIANNRGTGWRQFDFYLVSAIQLLCLTEYADFYTQSMIGNGLTDWATATWNTYNAYHPINNTGLSNGDGDVTANVSGGDGVVGSYMTYRGIENWYGHVWKWVDGFNINSNVPYFSNTDTDFADDTATNYDVPSVTLHNADGYVSKLEQIAHGFLAATGGGSATTFLTDYYYQASAWRVAALGGHAAFGAPAGGFAWALHDASSDLSAHVGGRVSF